MRLIPANDSEKGWRNLLLALTSVTALIFLYRAFFEPGTLTYAPYTIQDDARQFLSWMARLGDPAAMPGDLIANYWHSVCPPLYRFFYGLFQLIGIEPTVFARLLPAALLMLCAWLSWRVSLLLTKRPVVAAVASAFLIGFILHEDSIYSATPRAFSTPLFLIFFEGLLRNRTWLKFPPLFVLAFLYPSTAIIGVTMIALSRIGWRPFRIDLSRRTWLLGLGAVAVAGAVLLFPGSSAQWGPVITISEAMERPDYNRPDGRNSIVGLDGRQDLMCHAHLGLLPEIVPCWTSRIAVLPNFLLMLPLIFFAVQGVRKTRFQPGDDPGDLANAWALVVCIGWWAVAISFAFSLHLPSRYTQRVLPLLEFLAIGRVFGLWLDWRLREHRRSVLTAVTGAGLGIFLLCSFLSPVPGLWRPTDRQAFDRIAAMPNEAVIGGVSNQLDFVPAVTGRATLASAEHAIPYHSGYFAPFRERFVASIAAVATPDPGVLADYVRRYRVTVIAVDRAFLDHGELPARWATVTPDEVYAAQAQMRRGPSILQQRARGCTIYGGELVLLDAACLTRA